jgi:hypothetical protein
VDVWRKQTESTLGTKSVKEGKLVFMIEYFFCLYVCVHITNDTSVYFVLICDSPTDIFPSVVTL